MITWDQVVAVASELQGTDLSRQTTLLSVATREGSPWGALSTDAQIQLAAHLATLPDQAWPDWTAVSNSLGLTKYGLAVKALLP